MANSPATTSRRDFHVEYESDIVDERFEPYDEPENHEVPSRPISRIGFNRTILDSPPHMEDESRDLLASRTHAWKEDIGQTLGTTYSEDTDMETIFLDGDNLDPFNPPSSFLPALEFEDFGHSSGANGDADLEPDSDCSTYEDSDEETESLLLPPPLQSFTPMPFPAPHTELPEWTTSRPKFSCLPSPLSPRHTIARTFSFRHTPTRHFYHQHGYSRHALLHLKWFWAMREDDWMDPQTRLRDEKAYGGLSILGLAPSPLRGRALPDDSPVDVPGQLPPLSIHPRRGDLFALRDPYCMHIDRYFVALPMWTMSKTLWMFDVHLGASAPEQDRPEDQCTEGVSSPGSEADDGMSEAESPDTPMSFNFSDDSDTTLVGSDTDSDKSLSPGIFMPGGDGESVEVQEGSGDLVSPNTGKGSARSSLKRSRNSISLCKTQTSPESRSPSPGIKRPPWTTCWYRRWDLLMHLVRHDSESATLADVRDGALLGTNKKTPRFFIGEEDESMAESEDEDEDGDDMEDILILVNPLYRKNKTSFQF